MSNTNDKNQAPEDDDLMAMLEESQQDFKKKKAADKQEKEAEDKSKEDNLTEKMEGVKISDESGQSKNKPSQGQGNKPEEETEKFFKGFEEFAKNFGKMGPEGMDISPEELAKASDMFKEMFKEHQQDESEDKEEVKEGEAKPKEGDKDESANPFLAGYKNLSNDAKKMGSNDGMPDLNNLQGMFKDEEFKSFFGDFTKNLFNQGEGGGVNPDAFPDMSNPDGMMENLMKEFSGFLEDNQDNPELKSTIDKMMGDLVNKETMYPPMKMMKEEYPDYLEKNMDKLSSDELERYNNQLDVIEEICAKFEAEGEPDQQSIIDSLYKLQEHGAPPKELGDKLQASHANAFPGMPGIGGGMGNLMGGFPGMGGS